MSEQLQIPGLGEREYLLPDGRVLVDVHPTRKCGAGLAYQLGLLYPDVDYRHCPIHRQSAHARSIGPQHWRDDRGIMERVCAHGVGHPDPDALIPEWMGVHGCDGCCIRKGDTDAEHTVARTQE